MTMSRIIPTAGSTALSLGGKNKGIATGFYFPVAQTEKCAYNSSYHILTDGGTVHALKKRNNL